MVCSGAGRDTEGAFVWEVVHHIEYLKVGGLWFYVLHGYLACAFLWVIASVCVIDSTFRTNVAIFLFVTFYYYFSPLPEGVWGLSVQGVTASHLVLTGISCLTILSQQ